jgi:hypothetical protein
LENMSQQHGGGHELGWQADASSSCLQLAGLPDFAMFA